MGTYSKIIQFYSNGALLLTAMILGLSFVAQKNGMDFVGPFTFNTIRNFLGFLSLLPIIFISKIYASKKYTRSNAEIKSQRKLLAKGGAICGIILFLALSVNQYCMIFAPAGKAGFITALYIIFVPIIYVTFLKKKLRWNVKISIAMAVTGLYFLCFNSGAPFEVIDLLLLLGAFLFALHIIAISHFSHKISSLKLSCVQFLTAAILSTIPMLLFEGVSLPAIEAGIKPLLFSGVVVTGVAYTLQIFGQKGTPPVIASLLLSMESVFAVIGGMLFLGERLRTNEWVGCIIMISAITLSQLRISPRWIKKIKKKITTKRKVNDDYRKS